ncbi:MAG: FeoC-like transcriptional regulator [Caldilinea sp.]|nr:FeoC-like transcriptional regulator [Caldilinea sp.]MDW8440122.1 FeoC-like transcriptional regulator [Caldilineaceae bacterium]
MLWKILQEVEAAQGPVTLDELSRRLDIDRSALEGMIQFWVRKGRLIDDKPASDGSEFVCAAHHCSRLCSTVHACPYHVWTPLIFPAKLGGNGGEGERGRA